MATQNQNVNYQKELDKTLRRLGEENLVPRLLLHSCCAPCSSYVLEYLSRHFEITVLYYNPNLYPDTEFAKRSREQQRLLDEMPFTHPVSFMEGSFEKEKFYQMASGMEDAREGGERCFRCYELRLRETARLARNGGFDCFTTTLSVSPLKNARKLNEIGERLAKEYEVAYLVSDFKKRDGYRRSVELSREYGLYRQDYCGCEFSWRERNKEGE